MKKYIEDWKGLEVDTRVVVELEGFDAVYDHTHESMESMIQKAFIFTKGDYYRHGYFEFEKMTDDGAAMYLWIADDPSAEPPDSPMIT